jgi:hypothetical protein
MCWLLPLVKAAERDKSMKISLGNLSALAFVLIVFTAPTLACNDNGKCADAPGQNKSGHNVQGVPGPIAGAGLPVLAIGYGVYWLVRRRRKVN